MKTAKGKITNVKMRTAHDLEDRVRTEDIYITEGLDFRSMVLSKTTLLGLSKCGFRKPSPIQLKAIPLGNCGFDLIMQAKSGTGKTCVFTVVALEMLCDVKCVQVIIITPTREIAVQVTDVIKNIGRSKKEMKVRCFIGGLPLAEDKKLLSKCTIAVGTPGRLKQLIDLQLLETSGVRLLVLDEADKLLDSSLQPQINGIFKSLSAQTQVIASSATFPESLEVFRCKYMKSPIHVVPESRTHVLLGVKQFVLVVDFHPHNLRQMEYKLASLVGVLKAVRFKQCLVFSNYQLRAESTCNMLNRSGWPCKWIAGGQDQEQRLETIRGLRDFEYRVLLTTDLVSRGIDLDNVDLVVNLDVPRDCATYLHRMGRCGRYGSHGVAVSLVAREKELLAFRRLLGALDTTVWKLDLETMSGDLQLCDESNLEAMEGLASATPDDPLEKYFGRNNSMKTQVPSSIPEKACKNLWLNDCRSKVGENYRNAVAALKRSSEVSQREVSLTSYWDLQLSLKEFDDSDCLAGSMGQETEAVDIEKLARDCETVLAVIQATNQGKESLTLHETGSPGDKEYHLPSEVTNACRSDVTHSRQSLSRSSISSVGVKSNAHCRRGKGRERRTVQDLSLNMEALNLSGGHGVGVGDDHVPTYEQWRAEIRRSTDWLQQLVYIRLMLAHELCEAMDCVRP